MPAKLVSDGRKFWVKMEDLLFVLILADFQNYGGNYARVLRLIVVDLIS